MTSAERISIAVPLFNEQAVVPQLVERTRCVLDDLPGGPHQLILVDDGSNDDTLSLLQEAATQDSRITVVALSRNFGQQAALCAALQHVEGDAAVLMDGDLQDSPDAISRLLERFREGYDVVYAIRTDRKEAWPLRLCYHAFYRLISLLAGTTLPRNAGDFCLMSRRVVDLLNQSPERHRYLRGLRSWVGFRQVGVPIEREARAAGEPKYTTRRLLRLAFDGIFSFSVVPLRVATVMGVLSVLFCIGLTAYSIHARFAYADSAAESPKGFTALIVSISFFAGVQLISLGIIGEYIGRIYEEVKGRPLFVVDRVIRNQNSCSPNTPDGTANSTNDTGGGAAGNG